MVLLRPNQSFVLRFPIASDVHTIDLKYTLLPLDVDLREVGSGPDQRNTSDPLERARHGGYANP